MLISAIDFVDYLSIAKINDWVVWDQQVENLDQNCIPIKATILCFFVDTI